MHPTKRLDFSNHGRDIQRLSGVLSSTMHHFRRKPSSSSTPTNNRPPTPTSPIELIKKEFVTNHFKTKNPRALGASSTAIALSVGSPSCKPLDTTIDEPGSSKESGWRTAYGAARMAVEIAKESSDMFLPLKAVVGALTVLVKNYDVSPRVSRSNQPLTISKANHCQCRPGQRNRGKDTDACSGTRIPGGRPGQWREGAEKSSSEVRAPPQ